MSDSLTNLNSESLKNSIREISESKNSGHSFSVQGFDDLKFKAYEYLDKFIIDKDESSLKKILEEISIYHIELEFQNEELLNTRNKLEAQHLKFYELYELAPIGYMTIDENGNIVEINKAATKLLNLSKSEILNTNLTKYIHPKSQDIFYFKKIEASKSNDEVSFDMILKANNQDIVILMNMICNHHEKEEYFLTITDISKEKEIQAELENSKLNLSVMLESSDDLIAYFDSKGNLLNFNSTFKDKYFELFGINIDHEVSINSNPQNELATWVNLRFIKARHGESSTEIFPILNNKGDLVFYKFRINPITSDDKVTGLIFYGKDITVEKEMEIKLINSSRKYDSLISEIPDSVWSLKKNSLNEKTEFYVSSNIETLTGFSTHHFIDKHSNFIDIIHPNDRDRYLHNINNIADTHKFEKSIEYRIITKSGMIHWVRDNANFELSNDGNRILYGVLSDVTKVKNTYFQLKESESKLRTIFDNSIIGIAIHRKDSEFEFINNAFSEITGYSKSELLKMKEIDITHPDDRNLTSMKDENIFQNYQKSNTYEKKYICKDGSSVWVMKSTSIMTENDSKVESVLTMIVDINNKKIAEQNLFENELILHKVTEHAHDAIVMMDGAGRVSYWNKAATEIFGYEIDDILGKNLHQLLSSQNDYSVFAKAFPEFKATGKGRLVNKTYEVNAIKKDGDIVPVELSLSAVKIDNEWSSIAIIRDISVRKESEEEIFKLLEEIYLSRELLEEEKVKLNETNIKLSESEENLKEIIRMRDRFFKIIAHDLRNPIGSFGQLTSLMKESWAELDEEDKIEIVNSLDKAAAAAFDLLDNLLEWAKLQNSDVNINKQNIDLYPLLNKIISHSELSANNKNIKIHNGLFKNSYAFIDREMVQTIFRNLISNALKFTPNDGNIYIKCIELENIWEISIEDTGVGMSQEKLAELFRIDKQVTTRGTNNEKGTGLGLILCKEFAEKNNGTIRVESELKKGTKFILTLPKS